VAGTAIALIAVRRTLSRPVTVDARRALRAAGRHLVGAAEDQTCGRGWPDEKGPPLLGLGHGAAGVGLALAEIAAITGDPVFAQVACDGLAYDRSWYDAERVAWPDLRAFTADGRPHGWMASWCHGAIGIGLTRLGLLDGGLVRGLVRGRVRGGLDAEAALWAEASAALQAARNLVVEAATALRRGTPADCTPCHGLAGVVELLLAAERIFGVPDHGRAAHRVAALLVEERDAAGAWPCGIAGTGEVHGLMTGRAGIALTLLRASGVRDVATPLLPGSPAG
jgi:lantibiotic biosynthesis protein